MINKISTVVAAALILGSASIASAATTTHKVVRHQAQAPQGQLMLLENAPVRAPAYQANQGGNFQDNWDISY
jgi:hypothetical protein